jgi:hypothetical protein
VIRCRAFGPRFFDDLAQFGKPRLVPEIEQGIRELELGFVTAAVWLFIEFRIRNRHEELQHEILDSLCSRAYLRADMGIMGGFRVHSRWVFNLAKL